jgi:hypothetical protein
MMKKDVDPSMNKNPSKMMSECTDLAKLSYKCLEENGGNGTNCQGDEILI